MLALITILNEKIHIHVSLQCKPTIYFLSLLFFVFRLLKQKNLDIIRY